MKLPRICLIISQRSWLQESGHAYRKDQVSQSLTKTDAILLNNFLDADRVKCWTKVLANDTATIPRLEYWVDDQDQNTVSGTFLGESSPIPDILVHIVYDRVFHLLDDCDDKRVIDIVAFSCVVSCNYLCCFFFSSSKDQVTRGLQVE